MASRDEPPLVPFLGFEYVDGPSDIRYQWQERDFTRELVNTFNKYAFWVERLGIWENILCGYSEDDALVLRFEFTTLPFDYCLSAPYKFKSRIAFCATQLCYTKGLYDKLLSMEDIRGDDQIAINTLSEVAKHWPSGQELVKALREVDAQQYRDATDNYRNKSQHRHPQCLDIGLTTSVVRSFRPGYSVSYSFGESAPLTTSNMLPVLVVEADRMRAAFLAYRALVNEHACVNNEI